MGTLKEHLNLCYNTISKAAFSDDTVVSVEEYTGRHFCTLEGDWTLYLEKLLKYCRDKGFDVKELPTEKMPDRLGRSERKTIEIRAELESGRKFLTLAHELGHALLHQNGKRSQYKSVRETEAECFAYVLGSAIGLDNPDTIPYILSNECTPIKLENAFYRIANAIKEPFDAIVGTP